jgi:uncharacterized RDD family membrane protein YckC
MTSSGTPRTGEDGPEQEAIWDASGGDPAAPAEGGLGPQRGRASRDLTRTLTSTARTPGPGGSSIADVPNRILALIVDVLVLAVAGFVLAWLLGGLVEAPGAIEPEAGSLDVAAFVVVIVIQLALSLGYFAGAWVTARSTPGMRLLGLRIGDEADGRPIGWRAAGIRWLLLGIAAVLASTVVYVPDTVGLLLGAMGAAWLLLLLYTTAQRPTRQGLHDRLAHTIVYRARRSTS